MTALLEVDDVHTYYDYNYILQGVSLGAAAGTVTAVLGRNGVGKTTLMRSIVGFTPPRRGRVQFAGEEIQALPAHTIARKGISLVPQGRRVFGSLSVVENLKIGARPGGNGAARWTLETVLDLFPRLRERTGHFGAQLSGGEQSMLAIARALMSNPTMLLMDEPSEGLAPLIVREVERTLRQLKEIGLAVVLVEQNLPLALSVADTAYIISKGRIVFAGDPGEVRDNAEIRTKYLGV
jgi:branched-chain amino acid transport system ATP-binding protein